MHPIEKRPVRSDEKKGPGSPTRRRCALGATGRPRPRGWPAGRVRVWVWGGWGSVGWTRGPLRGQAPSAASAVGPPRRGVGWEWAGGGEGGRRQSARAGGVAARAREAAGPRWSTAARAAERAAAAGDGRERHPASVARRPPRGRARRPPWSRRGGGRCHAGLGARQERGAVQLEARSQSSDRRSSTPRLARAPLRHAPTSSRQTRWSSTRASAHGLTAAHNASGATDVDPTGAVARIQAEIATVAARGTGRRRGRRCRHSDSRSDSERYVGAVDAAAGRPEALTAASPRAQVLRRTFARFERACAASRRARLYTEVRAPFLPHGRAGCP